EFFSRFVEKDVLAGVNREKGKFRAFLLASCKHFLTNERDRARAQKRGGGRSIISIDMSGAERRYQVEPANGLTPDSLFERRWALTLLEGVLEGLATEYREAGKGPLYDRLKFVLADGNEAASYQEIAAALGMTEAAVKKAAQRLRDRYRALLRTRIAETVES